MRHEHHDADPHTPDHGEEPAPDHPSVSGNGGPDDAGAPETAPDATLGGYLRVHHRPPAFEGTDGQPYSVSIEVERTGDLRAPYVAYLVFPRWAYTGAGIVGHVESEILARARTREQAREAVEALTLLETKQILDAAIRRKLRGEGEPEAREHPPGAQKHDPDAGENVD